LVRITPTGFAYLLIIGAAFAAATAAGWIELTPLVLAVIALCFACELMDSSLGMGYGTALTPILLLFGYEPLQLVPTILISELVTGIAASFFHHEAGNVDFRSWSPDLKAAVALSLASVVGVVAGVNIAFAVSQRTLTIVIGAVLVGAGTYLAFAGGRRHALRRWKVGVLTVVASCNKSVSGGGYGPLMTSGQVLSGIHPKAAVGITSMAEASTCAFGAALFLLRGGAIDRGLLLPVVIGALASVPFSAGLVKRIDEKRFKLLIAIFAIVMGLVILAKSVAG
jgi:uncharacterized protein